MSTSPSPTPSARPSPGSAEATGEQPWLHRLEIAVDGPMTALSSDDGAMGAPGTGVLVDDRRVVSELEVLLDGQGLTPVATDTVGSRSRQWLAARRLGTPGPDATVEVHLDRRLDGLGLVQQVSVVSRATEPVEAELSVRLAGDGAEITAVKSGAAAGAALPVRADGGSAWEWADQRHRTRLVAEPAGAVADTADGLELRWPVRLQQGGSFTATVRVEITRARTSQFDADAASGQVGWDPDALAARASDPQLASVVRTNLVDLQHLALNDPDDRDDVFIAAGSPWYLTLFGRDSLWSARFMLGISRDLALGTLGALARRQGEHADPLSAAEPGKILHEVRRTTYRSGSMVLPSVYYGSVDATPLWIVLLHEVWRDGATDAQVEPLLPALRAALGWLDEAVRRSPDGLLRYVDETGHGLSNQGWKDSGDSMRRADGSIAPAPIALLEAQAYAVQAARGAAELLEAFGARADGARADGARADVDTDWRAWADALATRVRELFWVGPADDRYLAMALDAHGDPVDGVGSNMGHALGTGLLDAAETRLVVERLMRPDLLRDFGLGTLSADNPAYNPIGYHTGSVWTHDTAIAIRGLLAEGYRDDAAEVARRLVRLGAASGDRFPELCGGEPVGSQPVPYPASCRPQGWSAASAAVLLEALG